VSRNIAELSVFGEYRQVENRITAALLHIFKVGGEPLMRDVLSEIGVKLPSSDIEIFCQHKENESIPDGHLESNFSFRLLIESKINKGGAINKQQLDNHKSTIRRDHNDFLLYITTHDEKPKELDNIAWTNWLKLQTRLENYTSGQNSGELLEFLISNFRTLLENQDLLSQSWSS